MAPRKISWSERNMVNAVYAVENNILSAYAAAKIYRIPQRTLREYLKKDKLKSYIAQDDVELFEKQVKKDDTTVDDDDIKIDDVDTNTSWFNIQATWYCHACKMDRMADMRQCSKCCRWYHEACVGLTADDLDPFECPVGC